MSVDLLNRARITESNLELRRRFIALGPAEMATLAALAPWADAVADDVAREFYDHQFSQKGSREFFENFARAKGLPLDTLRSHLERAQAGYYRGIFSEAARGGKYGTEYFAQRMHIGALHNVIDLPVKWYIGAYTLYQDLTRKYLMKRYWFRPVFRVKAETAIFRVFNYDQQAVLDSFFLELLGSLGFDTGVVSLSSADHDVGDNFREFKQIVRGALVGLTRASIDLGFAGQEVTSAATQVSDMVQQQASSLEETSAMITEISRNVRTTAENAQRANALAIGGDQGKLSVAAAMENISSASKRIENITSVITDLSFQTNLLALNAAVEAARAGKQGLGFAVVASEVRNLAQRSATAAKEISGLIADAAHKVDEGTKAVAAMTDLIISISSAADEQSEAVGQVSLAVQQVDSAMQSNAAQAEELTATAHRIAEQALALRDLSASFDLGDDVDAPPPASEAPPPPKSLTNGHGGHGGHGAPAYHAPKSVAAPGKHRLSAYLK
ncbi:MAG: methyl-accepting chemotaxis protein [Gemmatimonadota bacterium]|nr:methyl-accepting chemotaxis protein [Gemmatimonadota bacterium]